MRRLTWIFAAVAGLLLLAAVPRPFGPRAGGERVATDARPAAAPSRSPAVRRVAPLAVDAFPALTLEEVRDDPNRIPGPEVVVTGIVQRHGVAVAGALVRAGREQPNDVPRAGDAREWPDDPDDAPIAEATTDAGGRFTLRFARRTHVVLDARKPDAGYARAALTLPWRGDPPAVSLELERGHDLAGRVVDEAGAPVTGVPVAILVGGSTGFAGMTRERSHLERNVLHRGTAARAVWSARTDERGAFRFRQVPSGATEVRVGAIRDLVIVPTGSELAFVWPGIARVAGSAAGAARLGVDVVTPDGRKAFAQGAADASGAFVFETPAGIATAATVNGIAVDPPPIALAAGRTTRWDPAVPPGTTVSGRVIRRRGRGVVPSARVRLLDGAGEVAVTYTDPAGRYRFEGVPPGAYALAAHAPGLVWRVRRERCEFEITDDLAPVRKTLDLVPSARVVGRALGFVPGADRPWPVTLKAHHYACTVYTDSRGRFAFEHVPPVRDARVGIGRRRSERFDIVPGHAMTVDVPEGLGVRFLTGRVVDEAGRGVAGAIVHAAYSAYGFLELKLKQSGTFNTTTTDARGRYRLAFRYNGDATFEVVAAHPALVAAGPVRVPIPEPGAARAVPDLTLRRGRPIAGRVLDARGRPRPNELVRLQVEGAGDTSLRQPDVQYTDLDGRFRFGPRAPGRYSVTIGNESVVARPGDVAVEFRARHPGFIEGRVVDPDGRPPRDRFGLYVVANRRRAVIDPAGRFRISDLPPGRFDVAAGGFGRAAFAADIETGTRDLVLTLESSEGREDAK